MVQSRNGMGSGGSWTRGKENRKQGFDTRQEKRMRRERLELLIERNVFLPITYCNCHLNVSRRKVAYEHSNICRRWIFQICNVTEFD